MVTFPFDFSIKCLYPKARTETVLCKGYLRMIAGRREVFDAVWNGRSVVVKVFSQRFGDKRRLRKEWDGLTLLQHRCLNAPEPLFYGKTEDGQYAVVVEKISNSSTALDVFQKTQDSDEKIDLLIMVSKELAKQHSKGVLQKDAHLGNFLISGDKVFLLDTGQMRFLRTEVDKKTSIYQLAILASFLSDSNTESIGKLCEEYFNSRGWRFARSEQALLEKQITQHRRKGVKKGLKKCLRTNKRHLRLKSRNFTAVFDRDFCSGVDPLDFIEHIDLLMDKGQILKSGRTSYVSRLSWNSKDVVVKRYNHKGFIHSLRHTIKKSRARRGWLHAHRLRMIRIPTPKPLAYIEQHRTGILWQSYLVTEYVQGRKLSDFLQDKCVSKDERAEMSEQVMALLNKLSKYKITHSDLKHSNILITTDGPVLTDLDAMKTYKLRLLCNLKARRHMEQVKSSLCNY